MNVSKTKGNLKNIFLETPVSLSHYASSKNLKVLKIKWPVRYKDVHRTVPYAQLFNLLFIVC